jgi:small subunit ribosomal protein S20
LPGVLLALTRPAPFRTIRGYFTAGDGCAAHATAGRTTHLANIKSARKRARQADKHRLHNMGLRSRMRTQIKNVVKAIEKGDKEAAAAAYKEAVPVIDSMINKGIISHNKAARHKSRLNHRIKALPA